MATSNKQINGGLIQISICRCKITHFPRHAQTGGRSSRVGVGAANTTSAPSALETYAADKPLHKSHGSTDSVIWAVRTSSFLPKRQRLFHRRASHRPAVR